MKTVFHIVAVVALLSAAAYVGSFLAEREAAPASTPSPTASITPDDMMIIDQPKDGATVTSPLVVTGRARGTWFFEASFPVVLTDWDGKIIAQVPAQAQGDWMTTDWVDFEATLTFTTPDVNVSSRGALILKKDNPSGLPEHDDSREITVFFR